MLTMHSADADLTARARIRNAALELFGLEGVARVSLRAVAERAGVSQSLVLHHFGSKEGLRQACDDYVVGLIRNKDTDLSDSAGLTSTLEASTELRRYLGRAFLDGRPEMAAMFDEIVETTRNWLDQGEREGWINPSDDPPARAAIYATWLLAQLTFGDHLSRVLGTTDIHDLGTLLRVTRASIEIFTRGVYADDRFLTAWDQLKEKR